MPDSKLKLTRDILVIVCVIILAVLIYIFRTGDTANDPKVNLGDDLARMQEPPAAMPGTGAHTLQVFPEDVEGNTAFVEELDLVVTTAELNYRANRALGPMAAGLVGIEDDEEKKLELKLKAFSEMLEENYIYKYAEESEQIGISIDEISDQVMQKWAEGFNSQEEKLASLDRPDVTLEDVRRKRTGDAVAELVRNAVTEDLVNATDAEHQNNYQDWLTGNVINLEIDFEDETLGEIWQEYVDYLTTQATK
jgi:hypothetical protein